MTINIYEPPICCPTGVCGPEPDKVLIDFQNTVNALTKHGYKVNRYAINQQPLEFTKSGKIKNMIKDKGIKILPVTLVDDAIIKTESYPNIDDFKNIVPDLDFNILDEIIIQ